MERITTKTKNPLTTNGTDNIDFVIPAGYYTWTFLVYPKDVAGAPVDSTVEVLYGVGSDFASTNPAGTSTAITNKVNVITRTDQVSKVRLKFTNTTPANQGVTVELYGSRDVTA